jgi:hypothetical protein
MERNTVLRGALAHAGGVTWRVAYRRQADMLCSSVHNESLGWHRAEWQRNYYCIHWCFSCTDRAGFAALPGGRTGGQHGSRNPGRQSAAPFRTSALGGHPGRSPTGRRRGHEVLRLLRADAGTERQLGSNPTGYQSVPAQPYLRSRTHEPRLLPRLPRETLPRQSGKSVDHPPRSTVIRASG